MSTDAATPVTGRKTMPSLTSLRFITAAMVLWQHSANALVAPPVLRASAAIGYVGVGFFFVLSGFVLTWSARPAEPRRTFWRKRASRVLPLHLLTWCVALPIVGLEQGGVDVLPSLASLLLVQSLIPVERWFDAANGVSWSLSCEVMFYLAFPFLLPRLQRLNPAGVARLAATVATTMIVVGVVLTFVTSPALQRGLLYINPGYRIGEFMLGMLLALAMRAGWRPRWTVFQAVAASLLSLVAFAVLNTALDTSGATFASDALTRQVLPHGVARVFGELWALPLLLALVASFAARDLAGRPALAQPWLQRLGTWSFALYLTHNLLVKVSLATVKEVPALRTGAGSLAVEAVVCVLAIAISGLAHELVEKPCERRLRQGRPRAESSSRTPSLPTA